MVQFEVAVFADNRRSEAPRGSGWGRGKKSDIMPNQLEFYIQNQDELVKKYNNQLIIVKDGQYLGTYTSKVETMTDIQSKGYVPGTFMIILCRPGDKKYITNFHSNATFDQIIVE